MRAIYRLILLIGSILTIQSVFCQNAQYLFRQISTERGLPGTNVRYIYQDKNGIMWLSVEALGLCRFNGRNFELFSHIPEDNASLSNNFINSIIEDSDLNLWIATEKGLNKLSRDNQIKTYIADSLNQSGLSDNLILSLFVDRKKNLWVGTGNGLYKYNKQSDKFEQIKLIVNESPLWVNTICEHSSGDFFIGTNNGLVQYNPFSGYQHHFKSTENSDLGPMNRMVSKIIEDFQGNLWLSTYRGVNKFIYKTNKFEVFNFQPKDEGIFKIEGFFTGFTKDKKHLWFASFTNGIVIINSETGEYQRIKKEENSDGTLKSNHVRSIYQDRSGLLWIAAKFEGLFIYDSRKEMFNKLPDKYNIFQSIKYKDIRSVYNDSTKGLFWVGTMNEGLYRIDLKKNTIKNYSHSNSNIHSIGSNRIHKVYRDSKGNLWIGQWTGLDLFDEKEEQFIHYGTNLVDCIIEDSRNNIWIGTSEGIYVADVSKKALSRFQGNKSPFFSRDAIPIMFAHKDKLGQIWFATRSNGLFIYNPITDNLQHYTSKNTGQKLRTDALRAISEDNEGNIWIGTKGEGLCIFNPKNEKFNYLTTSNGLASDFVLCIQKDLDNDFWIGGHNGLSKYNVKQKSFTHYTTAHGLQGNIFETGTNEIFNDGYLLFAGNAGLNIFLPKQINFQNQNIIDSVLITSVKVFDDEILRDIRQNSIIELTYKQNFLTFEFVLSDFVDPIKHNFSYRMLGISKNWYELGNKNYVAFPDLHPGTYNFEVKGTNEFGITNENPLILTIIINPPFYQTSWFISILVISISMIIFFFVRLRTINNRKIREYLESEIIHRTEKLSEANVELVAQNHLIESQKHEIEKNQTRLEEKVKERTIDLEKAKQKAEESDRLKSSFLANMSHEIRTPLNAILGFSSIIADSVDSNSEFTAYSKHINRSSEMLLQIINDILDISKIEAGHLSITKSAVNLNNLLNSIYKTFEQLLNEKHTDRVFLINKISEDKQENLIVHTDMIRLKQIFFNLLNNAIKFTHQGFIEFGYTRLSGTIRFYVKDTGIGIKQNNLEVIFDRFVKIEAKNALHRGNGLGLSLCRSIVEMLGGSIWVESIENQGSTFYFTIPEENEYISNVNNVKSV